MNFLWASYEIFDRSIIPRFMEFIYRIQQSVDALIQPVLLVMLIGTGLFLTIRLSFIQFRRVWHGIAVARGQYDDPNHPGDVTHFQALTTALSATVGIGNIAGVAIAIHFGGPGALFWMWVTAILGMATKFTEVTLAQKYRSVEANGMVAGGPMYYIERGLGKRWKPMAMFVAFFLMLTAMLNGNAIQANTIADLLHTELSISTWISGVCTAAIVGLVILGGIKRIGKVTGVIAPGMALIYIMGGLLVLVINRSEILPALFSIFTEAFQPTAGIAGTGAGVFIQTMLWGIRRGLFSNEAGQGSAPIAHSAAKTDQPVSEGVVALLEPLIDTLIICSITGLVILTAGVWKEKTPTALNLASSDAVFIHSEFAEHPDTLWKVEDGVIVTSDQSYQLLWHDVALTKLYLDQNHDQAFSGTLDRVSRLAIHDATSETQILYGMAVETGAPLTQWAYYKTLGHWGSWIIILSVLLFGISTSISWYYYGDRCIYYVFGNRGILPYKVLYVFIHFMGAISGLNIIWNLGDTTLSLVTIPNVLALLLLSGICQQMTSEYFHRMEGE